MNLLLRLVLVLAGIALAAGVAVVGTLMFALWGLRSAYARLTGRPVRPFIVRMHPFGAFAGMTRPAGSRTPRADAVPGRSGDVTDVEAKPPVR